MFNKVKPCLSFDNFVIVSDNAKTHEQRPETFMDSMDMSFSSSRLSQSESRWSSCCDAKSSPVPVSAPRRWPPQRKASITMIDLDGDDEWSALSSAQTGKKKTETQPPRPPMRKPSRQKQEEELRHATVERKQKSRSAPMA